MEKMKAYASQEGRFEAFCSSLCLGDDRYRDGALRTTCEDAYQTWISGQDHSNDSDGNGSQDNFSLQVKAVGRERSWVITERGYSAITPGDTREGASFAFSWETWIHSCCVGRETRLHSLEILSYRVSWTVNGSKKRKTAVLRSFGSSNIQVCSSHYYYCPLL